VKVARLPASQGLDLPAYQTAGSAGMDLQAAIFEEISIAPGQRIAVPTGLSIALPLSFEAQIRPRSGLALKHGLTVVNAPGTIDSDYRGEIKVLMINLGQKAVKISRGDRLAQMVIAPVVQAEWLELDQLPVTDRGEGGFGHTGR